MLKELIALEPGVPILREYEDAPLAEDEIRIRADYGAPKHGTELQAFRGTDPHLTCRFDGEYQLFMEDEEVRNTPYFYAMGNTCVGRVVEAGKNVKNIREGQRVALYAALRNTHIRNASNILAVNSGMTGKEAAWNDEHVLVMDDRMTWKEAMCYDPAQYALAGVRDGHVRMGDRVAVFGMGAIGLLAAQMAKNSGASFVAVVDPILKRREVALKLGADMAIDPTGVDVGLELKKATCKCGVDVAIETSASYEALQHAIRGLAYGGNIAVVGWYKECKGGFNLGREAHFNEPNIILSRACSNPNRDHPRWDWGRIMLACWNMLSGGLLQCEDIVDPVVPFSKSPEAYKDIDLHPEKSVKLGVDFTI